MLLVMMIITMVLTWALNGEQRKRAVSLLLCAAMMSSYIPAINVARADSIAKPVLVNEQVLVNGTKATQIGAVTYSASGSAYTLDASSARVRVKNGDSISFDGEISAPEGETISWVRVDIYDANTEEPYTVGAEYYRASGMKVQEFDLASIPELTIGESFGSKDYTLIEGGKYIVMFCVGDSNGNTFADKDADIEDEQGPAILVDVKISPSNCDHPHSDYRYVRHSSGEVRTHSYGDSLTHQVEPLYDRYCGLCDTFLMSIWGQGTPEEHTFDDNGVCLACGYYAAPMMMSNGLQTAAIEGDITITEAKYIDEEGISVFWDCSNNACMYFRIEASIGGDVIFEETRKRNLTGSQNVLIPYDDLILGEECEIYIEGIAENNINAEAITEGDTVYVDIPEGEFLNITDPSNCELEFGAEEESQMIYFEASGRWTAECDDDWVTLSKTSGGSDIVAIKVTVDANDEDVGVERETSIYIALSSGGLEEEIYVYQEGREMTNYEKFQAAVDDLEIDYASGDSEDAVTADVGLPETGLYGVTISWESSNTSIIDDEGTVVRPAEDTEVELTATLSYYQYTEEKTFYLTVLANEDIAIVEPELDQREMKLDKRSYKPGDTITISGIKVKNTASVLVYTELDSMGNKNIDVAVSDEWTTLEDIQLLIPESEQTYGYYYIGVRAFNEKGNMYAGSTEYKFLLAEETIETITLKADKTEISAGDSVTFTAQSDADSVTLYIEAYNEVAGEWYVAVTKEMTKNGSEFTYTHEFANAGSKRVYAKTANGTTSDTIEITANALKETLEAPVGGTMTATVGEEVTISWGATANATGYTAHLYEMVDGKLESIGDVTDLIEGTSLKYTFSEAGEYHVGVIATAEGYNPSEQSAVIVTVEEEAETITLSADKTEINAGDSVTFTAQSNADSVILYIEAYNEVAGEWYVAVTKEITKSGSEFTYTHEFANAGSKRVYAKTANGTTSDTIEITANALKETLEAPVGGTMTATVGEEVTISWGAVANATGYTAHLYEMVGGKLESIGDVTSLINGTSLKYTFAEAGEYHVGVTATAEGYNPSEQSAVIVTVEEEAETITLSADKTEINAGDSVTFTAQSNADSVTLYIEAYNEVAGEWYIAVTKEMTKNGSEFTYTHEFANAGSKRVYAKAANGTTSNTIEITANALKETLEAPVGGTMTAIVGEEVAISWGAVANATGYTAHLYEMVDGKLESIGDVTNLISGTSLKYTFTESGEYHVGVIATAEGYNPSEQGAVIVTVEEAVADEASPWLENPVLVNDTVSINGMIKLEGKALDDAELKGIYLYIDGIDTEAYVHMYEPAEGKEYDLCDWNIYLSEDGWDEGYYSVKLDIEDSDGNFLEDGPVLLGYLTITGEETSPVIEPITSTADSPITAGTEVTFSTTAADDVKLAKIEMFIDGELKKTETVSGLSGTISYTTSALAIGEHAVKVVATDASGLTNNISLTVTVQKADPSTCAHRNTTVIPDPQYVSINSEQHKLVYTYWTHCLDCDTGLSNVQDEDLPEKHTWKDGACEKCKHACSHNYVADENKPVQNSGIWKKFDSEYHIRDQVKYWETCTYCGGEKEGELKQDASAIKEKHNMTNIDIVAYNYNSKTHQALYNVTCSANGCGHKLTSQLGDHEVHQITNGKCQICDYIEPIIDYEENDDESDEYVEPGIFSEPELKEDMDTNDILDIVERLNESAVGKYKESIDSIDPRFVDDYQLAKQVLNEEYNTDPTLDALVALTDPFELYLVLTNSEWLEREMLEDMLAKIISRIKSEERSFESSIDNANDILAIVDEWKKGFGVANDFLDENTLYKLITEDSEEYRYLFNASETLSSTLSKSGDSENLSNLTGVIDEKLDGILKTASRIKSISEPILDYAMFQLKAELVHFEVLEKSLEGTNDALLESVITEMKFQYTHKFLGGVWEAAKEGAEYVGEKTLDKLLDFVGGKMGGIYSMAYEEVLKASGIVDTVEGSRELIISDMYCTMINGEFRQMIREYQTNPDSLTIEDINRLSAIYDLLNSALIVRNESAKKLVDENAVWTDTPVVKQLDAEIAQLESMSLFNWKQNEYYDEHFFDEPELNTGNYYLDALVKTQYDTGNYGYTSCWDSISTEEKAAVREELDKLGEYSEGCGDAGYTLKVLTSRSGYAHLILVNEEGMGLLVTNQQTEYHHQATNETIVTTLSKREVDNLEKYGAELRVEGVTFTGKVVSGNQKRGEFKTSSIDITTEDFNEIMGNLIHNYAGEVKGKESKELSQDLIIDLLYEKYEHNLRAADRIGNNKYEQLLIALRNEKQNQIEGY